jgi:hypothetical protein
MRRFDFDGKVSCYSIILHIPADELWSFFGTAAAAVHL